jgi:hypothetical protein
MAGTAPPPPEPAEGKDHPPGVPGLMPSIEIDDQLWADFLQFSDQLEIKDPDAVLRIERD